MSKTVNRYQTKVISFRSHKTLDAEKLNHDLETAPWHVGEIFDTIDDQYSYWNMLYKDVVEEHLPLKRKRVRNKDVPFMNYEWKKAIREKRKCAKKYAKNKTKELNWEEKRKWRNLATKERRKAIKKYWSEKSDELNKNPRQFYKKLSDLF